MTAPLAKFVDSATEEFRKGPEVAESDAGPVSVVEVFAMRHADDAKSPLVDVHFMQIGFTEAAAAVDILVDLLRDALAGSGEFVDLTVAEFLGGPSYITTGGWIGSQGIALRLYALLEHCGLGQVVTPARLGMAGELADQMAGNGYVMFVPSRELADRLAVEVTA